MNKIQGIADSWQLVESQVADNVAAVDFITGIDSSSNLYKLVGVGLTMPADDKRVDLQLYIDAVLKTTGYISAAQSLIDSATPLSTTSTTFVGLSDQAGSGRGVGNAAGESLNFEALIPNPSSTTLKKLIRTDSNYIDAIATPNTKITFGHGYYDTDTDPVTGLRVKLNSANIILGNFYLFKLTRAM